MGYQDNNLSSSNQCQMKMLQYMFFELMINLYFQLEHFISHDAIIWVMSDNTNNLNKMQEKSYGHERLQKTAGIDLDL